MKKKDYYGYTVTDDGHIYNKCGNELNGAVDANGYIVISLMIDGKKVQTSKHRLVAICFVDGRTAERNIVDHINGDKQDNRACNLRWTTQSENLKHAYYDQDLMPERQKPKAVIVRHKTTNECQYFESIHAASKALGVAYWHANQTAHGLNNSKTAGGYYWHLV